MGASSNVSKFRKFSQDREPALKPGKLDVASSLNIVIYYISLSKFCCCFFRQVFLILVAGERKIVY